MNRPNSPHTPLHQPPLRNHRHHLHKHRLQLHHLPRIHRIQVPQARLQLRDRRRDIPRVIRRGRPALKVVKAPHSAGAARVIGVSPA